MKIRIFSFLWITLLLSHCNVNRVQRIGYDRRFFSNLDIYYPLNKYKLILKTNDSIYYLSKAAVVKEKLNARIITKTGIDKNPSLKKPVIGKNLILTSRRNSKNMVFNYDTTNKKSVRYIEISRRDIRKINVEDESKWKNKSKTIFSKGLNNFLVFFYILALLGLIEIIVFTIILIQDGSCYIATMVYGSYDAPEVMVLRKFRDEKLLPFFVGRVLVKIYYALSPHFVYLFKNNKSVNKLIKSILDKWVIRLSEKKSDIAAINAT